MMWHLTILKSYLFAQINIHLNDPAFFKPQISAAVAGEKKNIPPKKQWTKKTATFAGSIFPSLSKRVPALIPH